MAHPWHDLPNNPDTADDFFNAVIEISRGSKVKVEEIEGSTAALTAVRESFRLYRTKESELRGWG